MFPPAPPWSSRIFAVGVTGTNGKTTTTKFLAAALECAGPSVLAVTTVGSFLGGDKLDVEASYDGFVQAMQQALQHGSKYASLEVTSEALAAGFAKAWPFGAAIFTNLSRDHLDAHGSAEHYLASKAQLFLHLPSSGIAVLNAFDPASSLIAEIIPKGVRVFTYGAPSRGSGEPCLPVDLLAERIDVGWDGTSATLRSSSRIASIGRKLHVRAIGEVFVENAMAALVAATVMGIPWADAMDAIENTAAPPGRFQVIGQGPRAVIDYGHSPDALERTLKAAKSLCIGQLSVVFGAGGGRDRGKRRAMGRAARLADKIVLTSDNPRIEDPAHIAAEIRHGTGDHPAVETILDRRRAIEVTLGNARPDDVVVIAGRGPETEQVFFDGRQRLVDAEVATMALDLSK